jgi:CBS domain-containing protein
MFDFDVLDVSRPADEVGRRRRELFTVSTIRFDALVTEIPRGPALTLAPETTVAAAIESLRRRARGAAVIVQNHRPIGTVTERDILNADGQPRAVPVAELMAPCLEPLREDDTVGTALRTMCVRRQWHVPIVCGRGLFLGALDITDLSLWLRDRMMLMSVDAAFEELG